ncbi:MAG: hypothetical protein Q9164_003329 [Protoblastenia rupestris]
MRAQYNRDHALDILDLVTEEHTEFIPRAQLVSTQIDSPELKQSPTMSKAQSKRAQQQRQKQAAAEKDHLPQTPVPKSIVNEWGATRAVWQFLELADTLATMTEIFKISHTRGNNLSAFDSLQVYCQSPQYNNPQQNQTIQQQPFNPSIPPHLQQQQSQVSQFNGAPPNNFLSPAHPHHINLPGGATTSASPATLSNHNTPAMQNLPLQHPQGQPPPGSMAAPSSVAMSHQASHQGTNPSAAGTPAAATGSANASPNVGVTGKRRRPSGVPIGDDGEVNGASLNGVGPNGLGGNHSNLKVKQSPTMRGKKARANG